MANKKLLKLLLVLSLVLSSIGLARADFKISLDENNQAQMLDYEILILKAELATQSENLEVFKDLFHEINSYKTPQEFSARVASLKAFFNQMVKDPSREDAVGRGGFSAAVNAETLIVLLPLSGSFSAAGQAMNDVLAQRFASKEVYVLDTDLYDSMAELWKLVQMFDPDLIIGPLRKNKAQEFANLNKTTPTLIFSSLANPKNHPNFLAQANPAETTKKFFSQLLEMFDSSELAWIADKSSTSQEQVDLMNSLLEEQDLSARVSQEKLELGVDRSLAKAIGAESSRERTNWLQRTIKTSLKSNGYVRKDIKFIVISSGQGQAEQLAPLVNYHGLGLPIMWLPTELPSVEMFYRNLDNWQETYALFPAHFVYQLSEIAPQNPGEPKVGLFRALAELAIDLIEKADKEKPFQMNVQLGKVEVYPEGYYLMPRLVKLAKGKSLFVEMDSLNP